MPSQSHLWLRIGAVVLLAAAAVIPRSDARRGREQARGTSPTAHVAAHGIAARAETTAARLASAPRTAKLVVADADGSQLTN